MFNILSYPRMACALTLWVLALGSHAAFAKDFHTDRPNYLIFIADDHGMGVWDVMAIPRCGPPTSIDLPPTLTPVPYS